MINKKLEELIEINKNHYLSNILKISHKYLLEFGDSFISNLLEKIDYIWNENDKKIIIREFSKKYIQLVKEYHQSSHSYDKNLSNFIESNNDNKIIWGDCYEILKEMKSESVHCMVTSPPYYNARDYSKWKNLNIYLDEMRLVIKESFRVLDNHRVFLFNVGDIFDNDNLQTESTWGKRRIPLAAYFIKIFEEEGFTFVDDIIWDKGEVQSERHKNGGKNYPFYQYPMNCYEHLLIFHKHRDDKTRFPCPICGTLKVNGNSYSEIGLKSWECKNLECDERSKSNRGKRFSLKTLKTQDEYFSKTAENEIDKTYIKQFRRDIVKIKPVFKINSKGENILGHTAPFPKDIPEYAIKMFSYKGEKILDPFLGSGTSLIEADRLGRIGIGIELNKSLYRDSIIKNLIKNNLKKNYLEFDFNGR